MTRWRAEDCVQRTARPPDVPEQAEIGRCVDVMARLLASAPRATVCSGMAVGSDLDRAVSLLRAGRLVAFPTETVYGLGADASSAEAVARIFAAKGRPRAHPVIVHLP